MIPPRTLADVLREFVAAKELKRRAVAEAYLMTAGLLGAYIRADDRWYRRKRMGLFPCEAPVVVDAGEVTMPGEVGD